MTAPAGPPPGEVPAGGRAEEAEGATQVADEIRRILADATGRGELLHIDAGTPLFGTAVALDSLTGTLLLREVQRRYGVDVAADDLNLDALATLGTLAEFVARRVGGGPVGSR